MELWHPAMRLRPPHRESLAESGMPAVVNGYEPLFTGSMSLACEVGNDLEPATAALADERIRPKDLGDEPYAGFGI